MALLRLVLAWLCAAAVFARHFEKPLPRRVRAWIATHLFKAELAADLLVEAASYLRMPSKKGGDISAYRRISAPMSAPFTLSAVVSRLNVLRVKLENLDHHAAMQTVARQKMRNILRMRAAWPTATNFCAPGLSAAGAMGDECFALRLHYDYTPP